MNKIAASILAADFAHLADDIGRVMSAGADSIHFDVMDMHYVPNLTIGPTVCRSLRQAGISAFIDVHLMVTHPRKLIAPFAEAGADLVSFHPETVDDVNITVSEIKQAGMQVGLVFNPDQPVNIPNELLPNIDMILLMSVFPGFGGQSFIPDVLEKIAQTRLLLDSQGLDTVLAVDGGVKVDNIGRIAEAGARYFVVGSGLFSASDYGLRMRQLRDML